MDFEQFQKAARAKYGPEYEFSFEETDASYSCKVIAGSTTALLTYDKVTGERSEQVRNSNVPTMKVNLARSLP